MLKVDPDKFDRDIPDTKQEFKKPADFDETAPMEQVTSLKVKDGVYTGTIKNGVPNGYGGLVFHEGVNHHTKFTSFSGTEYNTLNFVFYEGNFKFGSMHG